MRFTVLDPQQRQRLDRSEMARKYIADYRILNIDFYPRESHLITFRDPWSFPVLFHPACNGLVRKHLEELAQKVKCPLFHTVCSELPFIDCDKDCLTLRLPGRVSGDPVLPAARSEPRSWCAMLPPRPLHPK